MKKVKDARRESGNEGSYDDHVRRQEMAYALTYEEFEAGLTPAQRGVLGKAAAPDLEDHKTMNTRRTVIGVDRDVADSQAASYAPDMASAVDGPAEQVAELAGITLDQARAVVAWADARVERESETRKSRVVVKIAGAFLNCANPKLQAAALAYASDLAVTSGMGTMQDYAQTIAVSRAAISKVSKWWQRELELPPGSHMRDEGKCKIYSAAQKAKHWRKQKMQKS